MSGIYSSLTFGLSLSFLYSVKVLRFRFWSLDLICFISIPVDVPHVRCVILNTCSHPFWTIVLPNLPSDGPSTFNSIRTVTFLILHTFENLIIYLRNFIDKESQCIVQTDLCPIFCSTPHMP